jgi:hypothetical protein
MRQRYLLGRYNFEKFGKHFSFDDPSVNMFEQMQVQSTDVYRTITSGYSELAGMVMQNQKPLEISGKQEQAFKTSGRGMPKMNIRNAQ